MNLERFERMKSELVRAVQVLSKSNVSAFLSGSFALCVYAEKLSSDPQDIDLLFRSREEHEHAVSLLEENLHFKRIKELTWESSAGTKSVNTKLTSPTGIDFDLACTVGDIQLSLDPNRIVTITDCAIPILSLEDLQKSYQRFLDEKPGTQEKLDYIDGLISNEN